jgi:hypothetical protein
MGPPDPTDTKEGHTDAARVLDRERAHPISSIAAVVTIQSTVLDVASIRVISRATRSAIRSGDRP